MFVLLDSLIGGFVAGLSADYILRRMQQEMPNEAHDDARTNVRKLFQGISLFGSAASLGVLALSIPEEPWVAQTFLTASLGLLSFSAAGFDAAIQDKAGEKWAGLLYSVSTLPAVMCKWLRKGVYVSLQCPNTAIFFFQNRWNIRCMGYRSCFGFDQSRLEYGIFNDCNHQCRWSNCFYLVI